MYCGVVLEFVSSSAAYDLPNYSVPDGKWIKKAMCRGVDVKLFFPPNGVRPRRALSMCDSCSVKSECLEWALENNVHFGVWGGLTERQRFDEKRKRKEKSHTLG